jgi:hypothetical protein
MNEYVHTDTAEDLVLTLELACEFLAKTRTDDRYWKWFIYSLHSAVQSTAALSLESGNCLLVQKSGVMQRMLAAHEIGSDPVEPHMDNFSRLIEKVFIKHNLRGNTDPICDNGHIASLQSLNELRDEFVHFNVKSWAIETQFILQCTCKAIDFIHHYACSTPAIIWHEELHQQRADIAIDALKTELERLYVSIQPV